MENKISKVVPTERGVMTNVHKLSLDEAKRIVAQYEASTESGKKRVEDYCKLHTFHSIKEWQTKVAYAELDDKCKTFVSKMLDAVSLKNSHDRFLFYKLSYELKVDKQTGNVNPKDLKYSVYCPNKTYVNISNLSYNKFSKLQKYLKLVEFYLLDRNSIKFEKEAQ